MTGKLDVLAAGVIKNFRDRGLSLSLAESCTGGMISAALTGIPGPFYESGLRRIPYPVLLLQYVYSTPADL